MYFTPALAFVERFHALSFGKGPKIRSWPEATPLILATTFHPILVISYPPPELDICIVNTRPRKRFLPNFLIYKALNMDPRHDSDL